MSKYLNNGMRLVYLDQCALSRFLERPENEQWLELRKVILKGNASRRILCPSSLEHFIETSPMPDDDAIFLDELMEKLSFKRTLPNEFTLITRQIIAKLRNRPLTRGLVLEKSLFPPIRTPGALMELRQMKSEMDNYNAWAMQAVNEFNVLICNKRKSADRDLLHFLIKRRTECRVKKFLAEVLNSLKHGRVVLRAEENNPKALNWGSLLVYELITKHQLTVTESQMLCDLLRMEGLEFIPTLKIKAELEAIQFFRREQIEPRDQYDITRAACVLPYADIFVTDGGKASAIRELKLDARYKTEVFSMKKSELNALTSRLSEIVN